MPKRRVFIDVTPLRQSRDLRVLLGGQVVSLLGTQLTVVAVPYQVYRLTHSSLDVGLVSLAQLVPLLLCSLWHATRPGLRSIAEGFRYIRGRQGIQGAYLIDAGRPPL